MRQIKKVQKYGLKFDSRLELFFYELLKKEKIPFEFQITYQLLQPFKYDGKAVRAMTLTVDFDFTSHGINAIVDTKGFQRNDNILKWKWFRYVVTNEYNMQPKLYFPKNQKECVEVVGNLKKFCKLAKL
jgi:Protein of unknown function (DUF1064)